MTVVTIAVSPMLVSAEMSQIWLDCLAMMSLWALAQIVHVYGKVLEDSSLMVATSSYVSIG